MPYELDSPLASALGFTSSYLAGRQQKQKDLQGYQQQALENAQNAARLKIAQDEAARSATKFGHEEQGYAQQAELDAWDKAHPQASFDDSKAYAKWASERATAARGFGIDDQADKMATDYRASQQAGLYGANAAYESGAKTDLTKAQTGLAQAKTQFEQEHTKNERGRFAHEISMLDTKSRGQMAMTKAHIMAQLQAQQMRSGTAMGVAQMNNDTRETIATRAALISLHNHDENAALQIAMGQYKGAEQNYLKNLGAFQSGKPTPEGFDPVQSVPNVNNYTSIVAPGQSPTMDPQLEALLVAALTHGQGGAPPPGGDVPHVDMHRKKDSVKTGGGHAFKPIDLQVVVPKLAAEFAANKSEATIRAEGLAHGYSPQDVNTALAMAKAQHGGNPFSNAMSGFQHFFGH